MRMRTGMRRRSFAETIEVFAETGGAALHPLRRENPQKTRLLRIWDLRYTEVFTLYGLEGNVERGWDEGKCLIKFFKVLRIFKNWGNVS